MKKLGMLLLLALSLACSAQDVVKPAFAGQDSAQATPAPALPDGVAFIERWDGSADGISIPYSKYRLDNGLTVVLTEDHSDPMAHVDVTYHVGSNREVPGRSGFAHFFEHMMFEGSEDVPGGDFSRIISDAGGSLNGSTSSDRTNYYETIPINQLETALWLEADRMGLLLPAVTEEKFEVQRAAVKNERGQRIDNRPYGRTNETLMRNLYPPDHPYSWPVIGWVKDLDAANLDDLRRFFLHWYGPNNATLTIGGDIDPQQTLQWIVKYFGPIPSGPEVQRLEPRPGSLEADRYVTLEDNIHLPAIAMLYPTVYYRHPDEAPLDAAAKIIGQGKASLLYQRLVQTGRAVSAYVTHACRELACEMAIIVVQNPSSGESLAQMEQAVRDTLAEFAKRGVNDDDLQKFIAGYESGQVFSLQSVAGKVSQLAFAETFTGDPKVATQDIQRYLDVKKEDVVSAFRKYIENQPAVILSVVPNGHTELAAHPQNFDYHSMEKADEKQPPTVSPSLQEQPPELRTWADTFNRSVQPTPGRNPVVGLPPINDARLANGVRLLDVSNTETPTVTVRAVFGMGQRDEPAGKAGLAALTASLMGETTRSHSAAGYSEALERIGASVSVAPGDYETSVTLNVLSKHLDEGMALMMERILEPAFTEEDFKRVKSQLMESLMQARKSGPALAGRAISAVLDGPTHPLSYPSAGLPSTVSNITLDDVKAFYAANIPAHLQGVLASSSVPMEQLRKSLEPLGALKVEAISRQPVDGMQPVHGRTIYLVNKEGAAQSSLRIAHPSLPYDALGDYYLANLANFVLGGTFDSRINLNLREDKGYTYGAYSGFSGGPELGRFQVSTEVSKESTADAIKEVLGELDRYASDGMTKGEYTFLQNAIGQSDALQYETPGAKLGLLAQVLRYDLPLDYRGQQQTLLRSTDRETLNAVAHRLIDPGDLAIVVVGDAAALRPQLDKLSMPIKMLDEDGNEIENG